MGKLLLILILFGDPQGEAAAKLLAPRLAGEGRVVLVGPAARDALAARSLTEADLEPPGDKAVVATRADPTVAIIVFAGDRSGPAASVLETRIYKRGRRDDHTGIAEDPLDRERLPAGAVAAAQRILAADDGTTATAESEPELAALARAARWGELAARVAERQERTPRAWYLLVAARCRLGQTDAAREAQAAFAAAHPGHAQVAAAAELIAGAQANFEPPPAADGDVLR